MEAVEQLEEEEDNAKWCSKASGHTSYLLQSFSYSREF